MDIMRLDNLHPTTDLTDYARLLCEIAILPASATSGDLMGRLYATTSFGGRVPASGWNHIRRNARWMLLHLWAEKEVLLPITFSFKGSLTREEQAKIAPSLLRFCLDYQNDGGTETEHWRIRNHTTRWLLATSWYAPRDVDVRQAIGIARFLNDCKNGKIDFPAPSILTSVRFLLSILLDQIPDEVRYDREALSAYDRIMAYRLPEAAEEALLETIVDDRAVLRRKKQNATRRKRYWEVRGFTGRVGVPACRAARTEVHDGDANVEPEDVENREKGSMLLIFERKYKRVGWFPDTSELSFLSTSLPEEARGMWSRLFDSFLAWRSKRGLEDGTVPRNALRVLADYLAVCLPVSMDSASVIMAVPARPGDFTRFPFIDDAAEDILGGATLLNYVAKRFTIGSAYSHLNQIRLFFEFIGLSYQDNAEVTGESFRNPISKDFDLPKTSRISAWTNKRPLGKHVVPHLLKWLYAVEAFGMMTRAKGGQVPNGGKTPISDDSDVSTYRHLGETFRVDEIPNRLLLPQPGRNEPSLTQIRMIIVALETGLRFQSIQWLSRETFDGGNAPREKREFYSLRVNTDKSNDGFTTVVLPRVRDVLLRESADQESLMVEDVRVPYAGRENSRFAPLLPLFRNVSNGQPYSDKAYSELWLHAMRAFQIHYNRLGLGLSCLVDVGKPPTVKVRRTVEGYHYCRLHYMAIHTPHSCRSTFITRRTPFMTLDDVATIVGQADGNVASHYDYPDPDSLGERLLHADAQVLGEMKAQAAISSGPALIKAKEQNSALVRSFRKDREKTIRTFGIMALTPAMEPDEADPIALDLLRSSPMASIVFRETHICPVGEYCPAEIVAQIGGNRRCGTCPLACKSIDHLPAIAAKRRELKERLLASQEAYGRMAARGSEGSELGEIYDAIEADLQELLGWSLAEEILSDMRRDIAASGEAIHAASPEIIRRHLLRVTRPSSDREFLLRRVVESNAYPTLETDRLRFQVMQIKSEILAGLGDVASLMPEGAGDPVAEFAGFIKTVLKARNISIEQLADAVRNPASIAESRPLLLLPPSEA
ncbi:hypothetical protein EBE87_21540 [Pseudoroseomonas wenyumeiae]|uniref:Uncharacterized protein n=2 Tax=Teichococcus wenyumeiae TaxID=2478470 RepID=A0A3A9JAP0_9PROT|nr:hypothetical protein D6Z83_16045 [Pseudoroseomonas wenyumeiae]RMI19204.1 hypothetical protein EBE87_21540 [Pseudoroseomonas wenyumeiae]